MTDIVSNGALNSTPTKSVRGLQVPYAEMASKTLVFAIYDFDRFSKHDQIGQVHVPLGSVDLGRVIEEWRDITSPDQDAEKVIDRLTHTQTHTDRQCSRSLLPQTDSRKAESRRQTDSQIERIID